jgi:K+ transporter
LVHSSGCDLARNARNTTDHFSIPVEQVVEVGVQLDL